MRHAERSFLPAGGCARWRWLLVGVAAVCPGALGLEPAALTGLLEEARVEMKLPGVRAAVRLADGRIVRAAVGLADREAKVPLNDTVGMPGGSTGKTFVAALTLLLVEDGALSLDDPASKWLGDRDWFKRLPNADGIRVRHLLSHTAGIGDYPATKGYWMASIGRALRRGTIKFEPEELIGFVLDAKPLFSPGEGFRYTDAGYLVLGRLIEAATGQTYYDLLEKRILGPQRLPEVRVADQSILPGITPGYMGGARNLRKDGSMKIDPTSEWTGGGLVTNPTMLVQFFAALADGRVVRPESFARMLEAGWRNPDTPGSHYGLGVFVHNDGRSFGHSGMWPGYRTEVTHHLPARVTIAVQTNRDGRVDLTAVVTRIAGLVGAR